MVGLKIQKAIFKFFRREIIQIVPLTNCPGRNLLLFCFICFNIFYDYWTLVILSSCDEICSLWNLKVWIKFESKKFELKKFESKKFDTAFCMLMQFLTVFQKWQNSLIVAFCFSLYTMYNIHDVAIKDFPKCRPFDQVV